jgi:hypothetical protein
VQQHLHSNQNLLIFPHQNKNLPLNCPHKESLKRERQRASTQNSNRPRVSITYNLCFEVNVPTQAPSNLKNKQKEMSPLLSVSLSLCVTRCFIKFTWGCTRSRELEKLLLSTWNFCCWSQDHCQEGKQDYNVIGKLWIYFAWCRLGNMKTVKTEENHDDDKEEKTHKKNFVDKSHSPCLLKYRLYTRILVIKQTSSSPQSLIVKHPAVRFPNSISRFNNRTGYV